MTNRLSRPLSVLAAGVLVLASGQAPPPDLEHAPVGILEGNALKRLGVTRADVRAAEPNPSIRYNGITRFLDRTRTVVTGTLDDSTNSVPKAIDAMDTYGIKAMTARPSERLVEVVQCFTFSRGTGNSCQGWASTTVGIEYGGRNWQIHSEAQKND